MSTSSDAQTAGTQQDASPKSTPKKASGIMSKLPPTMVRNLKDRRKWKNWFRSMIVIFVCMIYLVVQDTLEVLGQAGFFHCERRLPKISERGGRLLTTFGPESTVIVAIMIPPSMPLTIFIFVSLGRTSSYPNTPADARYSIVL